MGTTWPPCARIAVSLMVCRCHGAGGCMKLPDLGVAMAAITKNEGPFIAEWVAYHYLLGVEHFVIYDNRSDDATVEVGGRVVPPRGPAWRLPLDPHPGARPAGRRHPRPGPTRPEGLTAPAAGPAASWPGQRRGCRPSRAPRRARLWSRNGTHRAARPTRQRGQHRCHL